MTTPKFTRTEQAAKTDRLTKWDLIEAIAADAVEAFLPITGLETRVAAGNAFEEAGTEYASGTIQNLCVVAKFDYESTTIQQSAWRRYGWSAVLQVAKAGWSQEAAYDLLNGERKTVKQIREAVKGEANVSLAADPGSLDDRWQTWLKRIQAVMAEGYDLAAETERDAVVLGGYAAAALELYRRMGESQMDAELRQMVEGAA